MKKLSRKSQVDVALTIGSIIVPLGAIFGALIFAWAMIGPINDAAKLAAVISYDVATLSDVAYSVPDTITIWYTPPSQCTFAETKGTENFARIGEKGNNYLVCLNGFMNITGFNYKTDIRDTHIAGETRSTIYSLESTIGVALDPAVTVDSAGKEIPQPFTVGYPAFGNMKDFGVLHAGSTIPLKVGDTVEIKKSRSGLYDTLYNKVDLNDPLKTITVASFDACSSMANMTNVFIMLPPYYYFESEDYPGAKLCLKKMSISPAFDPSKEGSVSPLYDIYCFDFANQDPRCTFYVSDITKSNMNDDTAVPSEDPSGTCALVNITVSCNNLPTKPPTDPKQCTSASISYVVSTRVNGEPRC